MTSQTECAINFSTGFGTPPNNLGNAYYKLAGVRDKEPNLNPAIAAFREALRVRTFYAFPQQYAMTQTNLGNAYALLAEVRDKEPNLNLAIAAFREALRVRTFDTFPHDYGETEYFLAIAYRQLGEALLARKETEAAKQALGAARSSCEEALRVFKPNYFPQYYDKLTRLIKQIDERLADLR